jgi:HK97 family phage major capsid protein
MRLGKRALRPHPLSIEAKISNTLIRLAFIDIVGKVNERLAARFGMRMEYFYLNGNGANQPLGIFTPHDQGIPTGRDVTTKKAGEVQFNDLRSMKYAIKQQYWPRLRWVMSRQTAEVMANITDSTGRTLWADSVRTGEPPTLMGFPVQMSEFAPAPVNEAGTFTTGKYAVMLGSFEDGYMVLDAMNFKVEVYRELEARKNQTVYIGRYEGDGAPLNINGAEMWARLKIK